MKVVISFVVGALLTIGILSIILWVFRVEILNVLSGPYGVTHLNTVEVLQEDMLLFQDGKAEKGSEPFYERFNAFIFVLCIVSL